MMHIKSYISLFFFLIKVYPIILINRMCNYYFAVKDMLMVNRECIFYFTVPGMFLVNREFTY